MPFRRSLRPVKSEKHEIVFSNLSADPSGPVVIDVISAVETPSTPTEIEIGSTVRSVFFEINFGAQTASVPKIIHWFVAKKPFNTSVSNPSTYDQTSKRFVLKRGMEMLPVDAGTVTKRIFVIKIPPRMRRFGDTDKLVLVYQATSTELANICGFMIYKEFN